MKKPLTLVAALSSIFASQLTYSGASGLTTIPETRDSLCYDSFDSRQPQNESGELTVWVRDCNVRDNPGLTPAEYTKLPSKAWVRDLSCGTSKERPLLGGGSWDALSIVSTTISPNRKRVAWRAINQETITTETGPEEIWVAHLYTAELSADLCEAGTGGLPAIKTGTIKRIDREKSGGKPVQASAYNPYFSNDGRYLVFTSYAGNLDADGAKPGEDGATRVYLYDHTTDKLTSITPEANRDSFGPTISDDGNLIAFSSEASNLVTKDENNRADIFVYDRSSKTMKMVSINRSVTPPQQTDRASHDAQISGDGKFIVYASKAINLIKPMILRADIELEGLEENGEWTNVYLYQISTDKTYLVSGPEKEACKDGWIPIDNTSGPTGPWQICQAPRDKGSSWAPSISQNGKKIGFLSLKKSLVAGWDKDPDAPQVDSLYYVRDQETGRFSITSARYFHDGRSFQWTLLKGLETGQVSVDGNRSLLGLDKDGECTEELVLTALSPWRDLCQAKAQGIRSLADPKP